MERVQWGPIHNQVRVLLHGAAGLAGLAAWLYWPCGPKLVG
ncbi:MAG TPA: hypothetical protein VLA54_14175 [Acidimicrobiia bacterium]|nr:hypothetical protein [Acidimicrobiia bacterium]